MKLIPIHTNVVIEPIVLKEERTPSGIILSTQQKREVAEGTIKAVADGVDEVAVGQVVGYPRYKLEEDTDKEFVIDVYDLLYSREGGDNNGRSKPKSKPTDSKPA